jgi:ketosteroid isomerase-like protein
MGKTPLETALAFVDAVNTGSIDRLAVLMTGGHVFIDSDGRESRGKPRMTWGWGEYFAMVPDYRIIIEETFSAGATVMLAGRAEGTFVEAGALKAENHWRVPAAWRAVIEDEKVARWQVYVNPEPMSLILNRLKGAG